MLSLTRITLSAAMVLFSVLCGVPAMAQPEPERTGGPYVPTPQVVVDEMLRMAGVGPKDFVIDLGSGDGVIVLTAAQRLKAQGIGVEIDPKLVKHSNDEAKRLGVADRASFAVQDVFKADLSRASVVTLYLLPSMMESLRQKIYGELKPGTRVVSHDYHFNEWQHDDQITFDVPEKEKINGVPRATIYLWIVPAKTAGRWQLNIEGDEHYEMTLRQTYQMLDGTAVVQGRNLKLAQPVLRGQVIRFSLGEGAARRSFSGRVDGDVMRGTVELGEGRKAQWTATRQVARAAALR